MLMARLACTRLARCAGAGQPNPNPNPNPNQALGNLRREVGNQATVLGFIGALSTEPCACACA